MQKRLFKIANKISNDVISAIILPDDNAFRKYLEDHPNYREDTEFIVNGTKRQAPKKDNNKDITNIYKGKEYSNLEDLISELRNDFSLEVPLKGGKYDGCVFYGNGHLENNHETFWNWNGDFPDDRNEGNNVSFENEDFYVLNKNGKILDDDETDEIDFEYYDQIKDVYDKKHEYDGFY
jgi:hypothetical protein